MDKKEICEWIQLYRDEEYVGRNGVYTCVDGKYLGKGGNAIVFEVENQQHQRFALKVLYRIDDKRIQRLKNEIEGLKNLQKLSHVLPLVDSYVEEGDKYWYVMPRMRPLKEILKKCTLRQKCDFLLQVANILEDLHNNVNGYAHRDIKLGNLLYDKEHAKVVLGDFGLIWSRNYEALTDYEEDVGPVATMPPWIRRWIMTPNKNYAGDGEQKHFEQAVDRYEFIKTIWQVFTEKENGLGIVYSSENKRNYLSKAIIPEHNLMELGGITFAPLHDLFEYISAEKPNEVPGWKVIIEKLQEFSDCIGKTKVVNKKNIELMRKEMIYHSLPDQHLYHDSDKIKECISKLRDYQILLKLPNDELFDIQNVFMHKYGAGEKMRDIIEIVSRQGGRLCFCPEKIEVYDSDNVLQNVACLYVQKIDPLEHTKKFSVVGYNNEGGLDNGILVGEEGFTICEPMQLYFVSGMPT